MKPILSVFCAAAVWLCGGLTTAAPADTPIRIAHRGAPDFAPENTLASLVCAVEQGADAVELDLHLTADGQLAVHHDDTTGRVWNRDLNVAKSTMAELQELRLSNGFRVAFPRYTDQRIPTFDQAVGAIGDRARIFAELKSGTEQAAQTLFDRINALGIRDRITVISFHRETVTYFCERGIPCAWLVQCKASDLPGLKIPDGAALDVNCDALGAASVSALHARGITVYCWTAAGKKEYRAMSNLGVDGITVNNLAFLAEG